MRLLTGILEQQVAGGAPPGGLVVQSVTESTFTTNVTTHNVNMPASVSSGDLLLALWANDGTATVTMPGGWDVIIDDGASAARTVVLKKSAAGTEGGTTVNFQTSATERAVAQVFRITGWSGNLAYVEGNVLVDTSGTARTCPSLTPSFGAAEALWIASLHASSGSTVSTYPTGYGNTLATSSGSTTNGAMIYSCYLVQTVSPHTPSDFVMSGSAEATAEVAIAIKAA